MGETRTHQNCLTELTDFRQAVCVGLSQNLHKIACNEQSLKKFIPFH